VEPVRRSSWTPMDTWMNVLLTLCCCLYNPPFWQPPQWRSEFVSLINIQKFVNQAKFIHITRTANRLKISPTMNEKRPELGATASRLFSCCSVAGLRVFFSNQQRKSGKTLKSRPWKSSAGKSLLHLGAIRKRSLYGTQGPEIHQVHCERPKTQIRAYMQNYSTIVGDFNWNFSPAWIKKLIEDGYC